MLAAITLRLIPLAIPHAYFPDEIFQYEEAAHRLVFGPAVIPWEYREHVRSWLIPLLIAGPMWLGGMLAPHSGLYLLLPKLMVLLLSLGAPAAGAMLGRRISPMHALFGMLVAATWVEFLLFASVMLTEPIAAVTFLLGVAFCYREAPPRKVSLLAAGVLFAATCVIRFQYGPAVLLFAAAFICRLPRDRRRMGRETGWLLIGAIPALLISMLVDRAMGVAPFAWLFANIHQNITLQRSHAWVDGPLYYAGAMIGLWGAWLPIIVGLALIGARRYPAFFLAAVGNLLLHSAIAHKEYRYILLTVMTLVLLAGIGTGDALRWIGNRYPGTSRRLPILAAAGWLIASASVAASSPVRYWWAQQGAELRAFTLLRDTPRYCGAAIFGFDWTGGGGYSYLHRAVPLFAYEAHERAQLQRERGLFNAVVTPADMQVAGFRTARCWNNPTGPGVCVRERPGRCATGSRSVYEINRLLIRTNR